MKTNLSTYLLTSKLYLTSCFKMTIPSEFQIEKKIQDHEFIWMKLGLRTVLIKISTLFLKMSKILNNLNPN